jgi:hypothetical protein
MGLRCIILTAILIVLQLCNLSWAGPTTQYEAEMVVTGWLKADPRPLSMALGRQVIKVETFSGGNGQPVYYVVYLQPSGFVIVPGDDLVEPIIAFVNGSSYDPSNENPLGALVTNDLNERIAAVRTSFSPLALMSQTGETKNQRKWKYYIGLGDTSGNRIELMNLSPIREGNLSDLRVAPLVKTKWYQMGIYEKFFDPNEQRYKFKALGLACQNYYTPRLANNVPVWIADRADNFPCGCVATVMAQLMRYHRYPDQPDRPNDPCTVGVGIEDNNGDFNDVDTIYPNGTVIQRYLLGGDELGGEYQWDDMDLVPDANSTQAARKAIGAICHDAGISVNMSYAAGESVTTLVKTANYTSTAYALENRFKYSNAVTAYTSSGTHLGPGLIGMINANLDARFPVIFGIPGHAVLADGYGYGYGGDDSTAYHHLNMGWYGLDDCWYNLPDINAKDIGIPYTLIDICVYNIFKSGDGEIISGRVLNLDEKPADANIVCLEYNGAIIRTVETDANGIFAFIDVNSNTSYSVWVEGRDFPKRQVRTGFSADYEPVSGNRWGIDFPGSPQQGILYVDCNMTAGANDGLDWNNAFVDLQDAIEVAANAGGEVQEIWVSTGTYKPDRGTGLRTLSFNLLSGVGIYGGFAGGENERVQRNSEINITILSGDLNGDDGYYFANSDENSYHVVNGDGTDGTAIIDGFTIIGGNANGSRNERLGGGIYTYNGSPTINNCIISSNQAFLAGGGMYNEKSSPTVTKCTFSDNSAERGGGMINGYSSNPVINSCTFSFNSVNSVGGGMENYSDSNPFVIDCVFSQNSAQWGGGIRNLESNPAVKNCSFSYNWALWYGGGIYNNISSPTLMDCNFISNFAGYGGGIANDNSSPTLTDCNFSDNSATGNGGAIENDVSNPIVAKCTFSWNSAEWGGGIFNNGSSPGISGCEFASNSAFQSGGGIENEYNSNPAINTCRFINNSARWGGGVRNYDSSPEITNCLFIANSADNSGGGVQSQISNIAITNCTFSANSASLGGGIYNNSHDSITTVNSCILWGNTVSQIYSSGAGNADAFVTYSDVQNGWAGNTNINVDPLFGDVDNGDYHLKSQAGRWDPITQNWIIDDVTSPCIDKGDPASSVGLEPAPNGGRINMGAYGGTAQASKTP